MEFDPEKHVELMAPLVGVALEPEWLPGVTANLAMAARMAALVLEFPLDDAVEPAAVFEAGR